MADRRHVNLQINHEDGMYWAEVEELPGCFASGENLDELLKAASEAISLYLSNGDIGFELSDLQPTPPAPLQDAPSDLAAARERRARSQADVEVSGMGLLIEA